MKEITVVHDFQVTNIYKDVDDTMAESVIEALKTTTNEYAVAFRDDTISDHVSVTGIHFFVRDQKPEAKKTKKDRIRELMAELEKFFDE